MLLIRLTVIVAALIIAGLVAVGFVTGQRIYYDRARKLGKLVLLAALVFSVLVFFVTYIE